MGSKTNELAYYNYPLIDSLSKLKVRGTSYIFLILTTSLFLPPIKRGPKLILPISKNTLGYFTVPTIIKYCTIFSEGISKIQ
jgi:hypothetical protein